MHEPWQTFAAIEIGVVAPHLLLAIRRQRHQPLACGAATAEEVLQQLPRAAALHFPVVIHRQRFQWLACGAATVKEVSQALAARAQGKMLSAQERSPNLSRPFPISLMLQLDVSVLLLATVVLDSASSAGPDTIAGRSSRDSVVAGSLL